MRYPNLDLTPACPNIEDQFDERFIPKSRPCIVRQDYGYRDYLRRRDRTRQKRQTRQIVSRSIAVALITGSVWLLTRDHPAALIAGIISSLGAATGLADTHPEENLRWRPSNKWR